MLRNFTRVPTAWIHQRRLREFRLMQMWGLKTVYGLAIIWGKHERARAQTTTWFPASLTQLSDAAHLSRNAALEGVRQLVAAGLVEQQPNRGSEFGAHTRTSIFRFADPAQPYFTFPHFHVDASEVLGLMRRGQGSLAALKIYLMLGTFRHRQSGWSALSYDSMEDYGGVHRSHIRRGLSLLYDSGLLLVLPSPRGRTFSRYYIQGLNRAPPVHAEVLGWSRGS